MFVLLLLCAGVLGCSTRAMVERTDGPPINGEILGSNSTGVDVRGLNGLVTTIDRTSIRNIDHPGNVAAVIGGATFVYGAAVTFAGAFDDEHLGPLVFGAVFMLSGAIPFGWGLFTWFKSKGALDVNPTRLNIPKKKPSRIVFQKAKGGRCGF